MWTLISIAGGFHKEHLKTKQNKQKKNKKTSFANVEVQNKKARKPCPVRVGRRVWSGFKKSAESCENILLILQKLIIMAHICQCGHCQAPFDENLGVAIGTIT